MPLFFRSKGTTTVYASSIKHQEFKYHGNKESGILAMAWKVVLLAA